MIGQAIADGFLTGAIIALGAIGVSLSLQILRFANFSHSELLTWGAYIAVTFVSFATAGVSVGPLSFGWQLLAATAFAAAGTALLAILVDWLVFGPLRNRGANHLTLVFASFGAALILRNLVLLIWGPEARYYTNELQIAVEVFPDVRMLPDQIFVLALAFAIVLALHLFLRFSRLGMAMRAMAESPALARICGVEIGKVIRWTWILSGALAAMAGVFSGLTVQLRPEMGFNLLLPLFTAAILGGGGSLIGAVIGGLAVGLAENLSVLVIPAGYKAAVPFLLLLAVLFLRPQGLFGAAERS
ncbi:MAG: branched-chain amino acid ABC transporter permease [Rhizobiales bacterium 65-9]|nr:branched-chain amino acid ABC transporter permease [Hyphomicrobiales bacterium]OJY40090.1 MAG: branched-chain amino acid ABC transporter permease [Rhizobiales bacterium 65-9]